MGTLDIRRWHPSSAAATALPPAGVRPANLEGDGALVALHGETGGTGRSVLASEYRFVARSRTKVVSRQRENAPVSSTLSGPRRPPPAAHAPAATHPVVPSPGHVVMRRYRIERALGEGGMGAVFQARDLRLDIDVAVKVIRSELVCQQTRERLLEEARTAARVSHPAAVRILDFDVDEHYGPFLVMELLAGRSLAEVLTRGVFSLEDAVCLLLPIVGAAAAAHAEGIVHRDIKPDNILLLSVEGGVSPKLVDFGVARLSETRAGYRLTQPGVLIGSPEYMAPEQTQGGGTVDARTDVWALCVVLYELVTGITPFRGSSLLGTLALVRCEEPEQVGVFLGDPQLWTIVHRGLSKDPSGRWPSAHELGRALARWALARGLDADAAGTSLSYWLQRSSRPAAPGGSGGDR